MSPVFDFAWDRPSPQLLKECGVTAVMRYLSRDQTGKNLTRSEAESYANYGIMVGSNWEYASNAATQGHNQGELDARAAIPQHIDCGGPIGRPIYFSVDVDIVDYAPWLPIDTDPLRNLQKLGPVGGYFQAIGNVLGFSRTGAYGGYWAISRLFNAGLIEWGWQTYAWSGSNHGGVLWEPRAQLRQVQNGIYVGGHSVDKNESTTEDFGQWLPQNHVPSPPPSQPPPYHLPHEPGSRLNMLTTPHQTGADVLYIQRFIGPNKCGLADGDFGPHTQSGVKWYQNMRGLSVDGVVGPRTWANMGVTWVG